MQVTKLNYGLSRWLTDDLQIELFPHAWLPTKKGKTVMIEELLHPQALLKEYKWTHGALVHQNYLN